MRGCLGPGAARATARVPGRHLRDPHDPAGAAGLRAGRAAAAGESPRCPGALRRTPRQAAKSRTSPVYLRMEQREGATDALCGRPGIHGSVVQIGTGLVEASETAVTSSHRTPTGWCSTRAAIRGSRTLPRWATWKAGLLKTPTSYEIALQYPNNPLDTNTPEIWRYGMWRFLQFLDDKGLVVGAGGFWPLVRRVIAAEPGELSALDDFLRGNGTSLGAELAAFSGRAPQGQPSRPPQLVARPRETPPRSPSAPAGARRSFEPSPPTRPHRLQARRRREAGGVRVRAATRRQRPFLGAHRAQRIEAVHRGRDSLLLRWGWRRGRPRVAGARSRGLHQRPPRRWRAGGHDQVYAQTQAEQCTAPVKNRACRVLALSGTARLLGAAVHWAASPVTPATRGGGATIRTVRTRAGRAWPTWTSSAGARRSRCATS